jgi:hypothetical protein
MAIDITTTNVIISAIVGLIAGGIASLIAPWIHWGIEKRRMRLEGRKKLLETCKDYLQRYTFNCSNFIEKPFYSSLRPYLSKKLVSELESCNTNMQIRMAGRNGGVNNFKAEVLDEIQQIEEKWKLI